MRALRAFFHSLRMHRVASLTKTQVTPQGHTYKNTEYSCADCDWRID